MRVKDPPKDDEYDALILMVWEFFSLRVRAENYFEQHKHVAKSSRGALPLPWREIKAEFERSGPPETMLTLIAKRHYGTIDTLIGNIRKVLKREREKVPIGREQQVDSHCLRWLTRQPGYAPVEKAGARQEILGVVRRENFDTLENRVLKDFLQRCLALSSMYLRKYEQTWPNDENVIKVKRLKGLCIGALNLPVFEKVKAIADLPQPNYVLQQDRLYSRIWGEYLKILREEDVAERMWNLRREVEDCYNKLHDRVGEHCSPCAKYDTPIWFNELDGRNSIVEAPIWDNVTLPSPVVEPDVPKEEVVAIDLTNPWDGRDELVIPNNHPNARPFIQNPHRPSREPGKILRLEQILEDKDAEHLSDYFRHLHGILGGKRWIVLVPDHWDAAWLERVIGARPPDIGSRSNFFLLWRSVAAALGYAPFREIKAGESLLVKDAYHKGKCNGVILRFMDDGNGEAIPQRASLRLHGENAPESEIRFATGETSGEMPLMKKLERKCSFVVQCGYLTNDNDWLIDGARYFDEKRHANETAYFDEMDALSIVATNQAEEVFFKTLVKHDEYYPGGKKYEGERLSPGRLHHGERELRLYLAEGTPTNDSKLNEKIVEFETTTKDEEEVFCQAEMTPGQGLATVNVTASFLERPIRLDLLTMTLSDMTLIRIERELKRHFPPTMPYVEASKELWEEAQEKLSQYLNDNIVNKWTTSAFYMPRDYFSVEGRFFDERTMSPIDRLKRENVFGNNPSNSLPIPNLNYSTLFSKLIKDYAAGKDVLRLIAWTYQSDNAMLESIRKSLYEKYVVMHGKMAYTEISFCSNNFADDDERIPEMISEALDRIISGRHQDDDYRLVYNLLQFHPTAASKLESDKCRRAFITIWKIRFTEEAFYENTLWGLCWKGPDATMLAGFMIKAMLFLLHRRRYDPDFLKPKFEWRPNGFFGKGIPRRSDAQRQHEATRLALIEYVNGRGTLEGIPTN